MGKLEEYKESSQKNRKAIPEIIALTMACWILKGFEWYFLALSLGITLGLSPALTWLAFFLIQAVLIMAVFIMTHIYHQRRRKGSAYTTYLLLLLFWLMNLAIITIPKFMTTIIYVLYALSLGLFILILYKVLGTTEN